MAKQLQVTAPLVVLKIKDGTRRHIYTGGLVPDDADPKHVEQLKKLDMVGEAKAAPTPEPEESSTPARSASKGDWVAYATDEARGADRLSTEDAEKLNRDDLAAKYLGPKGD